MDAGNHSHTFKPSPAIRGHAKKEDDMTTLNRLKNTFALVAVTVAAPAALLLGATGTAHAGCIELPSYLGTGGCIPEPEQSLMPGACLDVPSYLGTGGCIPDPNVPWVGVFGEKPPPPSPGEYPPLH
jgi:hypothetical protein